MAKDIVLNTLLKFLGEYINGLTKENFKFGLLSGKVQLKNLSLNPNFITKLRIPVRVIHGSIDNLEINIPWQSLGSQALEVVMGGVNILLVPLNSHQYDKHEIITRIQLLNQIAFLRAEKLIEIAAHLASGSEDNSFFKSFAIKIMDTLQLKLQNIHIRYEDSTTIPKEIFSCGILLESFRFMSTNGEWQETTYSKNADSRYKVAKLLNLGVYWNMDSSNNLYMSLPFEEWITRMTDTWTTKEELSYIIEPSNWMNIHVTTKKPLVLVKIEGDSIRATVDRKMLLQATLLIKASFNYNVLQRLIQHRPDLSPSNDPRGWWRYALLLVTRRENVLSNKVNMI